MTQIYVTPNNTDTGGLFELTKYANTVSEGILFPSFLLVIWTILFIAFKDYSSSRAWTTASFICFVLSLVLSVFDVMSSKIVYLFVIMLAGGLLWLKLEATTV